MKQAYEELRFYQNVCKLRDLTYKITRKFCRTHPRLAGQMDDAARSAKQNIREGYSKGSAGEFANGIRICRGSLAELKGDYEDCLKYGMIDSNDYRTAKRLFSIIDYQTNRYLRALYKMQALGTWKNPYRNSSRKRAQ